MFERNETYDYVCFQLQRCCFYPPMNHLSNGERVEQMESIMAVDIG